MVLNNSVESMQNETSSRSDVINDKSIHKDVLETFSPTSPPPFNITTLTPFSIASSNKTKDVASSAVSQNSRAFEYLHPKLRADRDVVLAAIEKDGWAAVLKYADKEFVLAAVKQNGRALKFASNELKADKDVVLAAVKQNGRALEFAYLKLRTDKDVVLAAVEKDGRALEFAYLKPRSDKDVVFAAVKQNGRALEFVYLKLRADKDVVLAAVEKDGRALEFADSKLQADRDVVFAAIEQDWRAFYFADKKFQNDKNVVLAAVKRNPDAIIYAHQSLWNNPEIIEAWKAERLVKNSLTVLNDLVERMQSGKLSTPDAINGRNSSEYNVNPPVIASETLSITPIADQNLQDDPEVIKAWPTEISIKRAVIDLNDSVKPMEGDKSNASNITNDGNTLEGVLEAFLPANSPSFNITRSTSFSATSTSKAADFKSMTRTKGDGACALHALNANDLVNEEWVFRTNNAQDENVGVEAKKDFLSKIAKQKTLFRELFVSCLTEFIRERTDLSTAYDSETRDSAQKLKMCKHELYCAILDANFFKSSVFPLLELKQEEIYSEAFKERLKNDFEFCDNKFSPELKEILERSSQIEALPMLRQSILDAQHILDEKTYQFCEKIFRTYKNVVLEPGYHISDIELELAAHLYGKRVVLFSSVSERILNETASEEVRILHEGTHKGGHYTRLS